MEYIEILSSSKLGIVIASIIVVVYLVYPSKNKKNDLSDLIIVATSALGVFGGLKVFVFAFVMDKCNVGTFEIERVYVYLGGISMIWISIVEIVKKFKEKRYIER
jgi:multisubunit Na+/H+ antiporter MnhB subunit